jgi:O-antigen ligase
VLLYGLLIASLTIMIYVSFGGLHDMFAQGTFGYIFGGVAFLCARRFAGTRAWTAPAFWGVIALILVGLAAYASSPGARIGSFVGYPITYGAILAGLAPLAVVYAATRWGRTTALVLSLAIVGLLVLSQSRSSWIAVAVMLVIVVVLLARLGRWREVGALAAVTLVGLVAILETGSLHKIVEERLNSNIAASDSVTHRQWSIEFAKTQLRERPIFGAGTPGYAGNQAADQTDIGAVDNGYVSIGIDLGLVGLLAALIPIGVALNRLARWLWWALEPPTEDLALALGIVAIAMVTFFYDSFYWAQLCLLLGGMGGTLSARAISTVEARRRMRARRLRRATRARPLRAAR